MGWGNLNEIYLLVLNQFAKNMKMLVNLIIFKAKVAAFTSLKTDNHYSELFYLCNIIPDLT